MARRRGRAGHRRRFELLGVGLLTKFLGDDLGPRSQVALGGADRLEADANRSVFFFSSGNRRSRTVKLR